MNKQNCCYWSSDNPILITEKLLPHVYWIAPHDLDELQMRISKEIAKIKSAFLHELFENFIKHLRS